MLNELMSLFNMDHNTSYIWTAYGVVITTLVVHYLLTLKNNK